MSLTLPLLWATLNSRNGDNVMSLPSLGQRFGETAESLGENRKRKLYVYLDSVIGLFLVHRHLPKSAMQTQDPNLLTPHPVLLPPHQSLSWKRNHRVNLGRGRHRKHKHTLGASHQVVPPTSDLPPQTLERGPSSNTSREPGFGPWGVGIWGMPFCPDARSMLPSCGHFGKCACSVLNGQP